MKILIAYYSRTGCTGTAGGAPSPGTAAPQATPSQWTAFEAVEEKSRWNLLLRQVYQYPIVAVLPVCSAVPPVVAGALPATRR